MQSSMRRYVTCHSKFSTTNKISTTPKSSKVRGGNRSILADLKNVKGDKEDEHPDIVLRKRSADVFLQSQFSKMNDHSDSKGALKNVPCKRRKNALIFDHSNDRDIPASVRSLQRVQSLSILETSRTVSPLSPDYIEHYSLRTVVKPHSAQHCAFGCISSETLCQLLFSLTKEQFCRKFFLVDCRYPFEYKGGHIKNAVNIYDLNEVQRIFYPSDAEEFKEINSKIPIFYCEFSQKRGPGMALELRRQDRTRNEDNYPTVDYKEIYVLDQGYQNFYINKRYFEFCEPDGYVPMLHSNFVEELKHYRFHLHTHTQAKLRCRNALFQSTGTGLLENFSRQPEEKGGGKERLHLSISSSSSSSVTSSSTISESANVGNIKLDDDESSTNDEDYNDIDDTADFPSNSVRRGAKVWIGFANTTPTVYE